MSGYQPVSLDDSNNNWKMKQSGVSGFESLRKSFHQIFAAVTSAFAYFAIGEVRSWSSSGIPSLQGKDGRNATFSFGPMPIETISWIASATPLGAVFAALLSGFFLQKCGRKLCLLFSTINSSVAFIALGLAQFYEIPEVIIFIRACMGLTVGFAMPSATIYIAETADPKIRGLLGSLPAVFMAFGISVVYLVGAFTAWNHLAYFCIGAPLLNSLAIMFIPESPVWLANNNKPEAAEKALKWLNRDSKPILKNFQNNNNDNLVADDVESGVTETKRPEPGILASLRDRSVLMPFGLCLTIMIFQQWCGVNSVIFYTVTIFEAASVKIDQYLATNIVGVVQLIATFLSIGIIDKAGRRLLLILSGIVMAVPFFFLGAFFYVFTEDSDPELKEQFQWVPLVCLIIFMLGYSIGFASIPFLLIGELLPAKVRSILGAVASSFNLIMTFLVLKMFKSIVSEIGYAGLFWLYACFAVLGSIFVSLALPETKGKSLEEIEAHFSAKK